MVVVLSERISISPVVNHLLMTILKLEVEGDKKRVDCGTTEIRHLRFFTTNSCKSWEKRTTNSMSFHSTRIPRLSERRIHLCSHRNQLRCGIVFCEKKVPTWMNGTFPLKMVPFQGNILFIFGRLPPGECFITNQRPNLKTPKKQQKIPPATKSDHFNFSLKKKRENSCILKLFESPLTKRWGGIP